MNLTDESPTLAGHWLLDIYQGDIEKRNGVIINRQVDKIEGDNMIVTNGKQMILDRLFGLSAVGAMTRCGVGTLNTAAAVGNTGLTGGVGNGPGGGGTFVAFDATPTRSALVVTCVTTFNTATGNIVWAELGLDNGTVLLNRIAPIGPFTKTSAVSIVCTVTLTQA